MEVQDLVLWLGEGADGKDSDLRRLILVIEGELENGVIVDVVAVKTGQHELVCQESSKALA